MLSADEASVSLCLLVCVKEEESCGTLQDGILVACSGKWASLSKLVKHLQLALFVRDRAQK